MSLKKPHYIAFSIISIVIGLVVLTVIILQSLSTTENSPTVETKSPLLSSPDTPVSIDPVKMDNPKTKPLIKKSSVDVYVPNKKKANLIVNMPYPPPKKPKFSQDLYLIMNETFIGFLFDYIPFWSWLIPAKILEFVLQGFLSPLFCTVQFGFYSDLTLFNFVMYILFISGTIVVIFFNAIQGRFPRLANVLGLFRYIHANTMNPNLGWTNRVVKIIIIMVLYLTLSWRYLTGNYNSLFLILKALIACIFAPFFFSGTQASKNILVDWTKWIVGVVTMCLLIDQTYKGTAPFQPLKNDMNTRNLTREELSNALKIRSPEFAKRSQEFIKANFWLLIYFFIVLIIVTQCYINPLTTAWKSLAINYEFIYYEFYF